ncbi:hypothetical protein [Snodgrassella sp. ESL0253]|uniref:hypothetical protein n=1 Tax=Snodgrassella sp. ESL0253 TaxID=2705031 RepID=UPI001581CD89|nr:hypothetical protein [Snodgrassella sp. ESL0253]NUE65693.1 hypothetical protein [Snodgrassella sp. ESL0253]
MRKGYTAEAFVRRFIFSLNAFFLGSPCFFIGIVGEYNGISFPFLRFLHILPMPEEMNTNQAFCFTLGILAFFATIIFFIMIYGWLFDICSNGYLKIMVAIGCCCGIPNAIFCLLFGSLAFGIGLLILPAVILSIYLTGWYFWNRTSDEISQC